MPGARVHLVQIGRIVNLHGIRGELRVLPHNPDSDILEGLPVVFLRGPSGERRLRVTRARRHKRFILTCLEGIDSANRAEELVGSEVWVDRDLLPAPDPHEVYHADLLGCRVRTEAGELVGVIKDVFTVPSNDVCVIEGNDGREHLIPLIADVVSHLDVQSKELTVRPIPGLLDS